ncbi:MULTISPECIES: hypothetical protein [Flavobacterium]|uniref:hypothetical protein n=1 Tax=Flavobacterium TaxID=237 RepID=UPI001FCC63A6|nr:MULTISPECIES: hypothetical protein [Flavobacterium]UOK42140.1 hypothetical protein LZF87_12575 [Flavobacterium enshiense]
MTACSNRSDNKSEIDNSVDTTKSFKVYNYWVKPKKSFDFNSLGKSSGDTLHLVTCSDYVYFPFGKLTDKSSLTTSLLKDFTITNFQRDTFTNTNITPPFFQWSESLDLKLANNKLNIFLDNDLEASIHGYIRGGQIVDSKVVFSDNIKVGMSVEDFYKTFFDYFPTELNKKYNVVEFESCVTDVTHIYTFENGQLSSVKFVSQ